MFRERVRLLEIIATIRVSISRKFIYVYRRNRLLYVLQQQRHRFTERGASKFYFYLWWRGMWQAGYGERIFFDGSPREHRLLLFLSDARIIKYLICDNLLILFKQDGTNLKYVYNDHVNTDMSFVRRILRVVPRLLAAKIWISSNTQRQCAHKWMIQKMI